MSEAAVRDILQQIECLSDEDRLDLSIRLAERQEDEWKAEAEMPRHATLSEEEAARLRELLERKEAR